MQLHYTNVVQKLLLMHRTIMWLTVLFVAIL